MPFCAEGAKRHYKGLTIDGIFGVRYIRLELHVGAEIALNFENVVCVRTTTNAHASKCSFINCSRISAAVAQWLRAPTVVKCCRFESPMPQLFTREIIFYMRSYLLLEK